MHNLLKGTGIDFDDEWDLMPRLTKPSRLNLTTTNIPKTTALVSKTQEMLEMSKKTSVKGKVRPSTMNDTTRTRTTMSRTNPSLNSVSNRKNLKSQDTLMDTSIIFDFINETEKQDNGLQKKILIKPAKKLQKQFFYNSIYDVRQAQSPLEMRISQLDKIHQEKTEDLLWNRPAQTMVQGMLETFARTQPGGAISQLLSLEKQKEELRKTRKMSQRPPTVHARSTSNLMRPRTVEGFFKKDAAESYGLNLLGVEGTIKQTSYKIPKGFNEKEARKSMNEYANSLDNINTLLQTTQGEDQIIENIDGFLEDTPDSKKMNPGETFERWSETSLRIAEETGRAEESGIEAPEKASHEITLINNYASMDFIVEQEEPQIKPQIIEMAPPRLSVSASNARSVRFNLEPQAERESKQVTKSPKPSSVSAQAKAVAIIRKRPNTTAAGIREALMSKAKSLGALCLEGKKALPGMFAANMSENKPAQRQAISLNNVEIGSYGLPTEAHRRNMSPFSPGNWVLEGTLMSKNGGENVRKSRGEHFQRKGHMPAPRMSNEPSKNQSKLLNMMKQPMGGMRLGQKGPLHRLKSQFSKPMNDSPNLNGWATQYDSDLPSFRMSRADTNQSVQSNKDSAC